MNPRQADMVLASLTASIERHKPMSEATVIMWEEQLAEVTYGVAARAAREWPRKHREFPSISEFLGACRIEARHMAEEAAVVEAKRTARELEEPPCSPERIREHVEHCKQILRAKGVKC